MADDRTAEAMGASLPHLETRDFGDKVAVDRARRWESLVDMGIWLSKDVVVQRYSYCILSGE